MNSIDRRLIIEEIAGISIYEEKKNQALNELAKVDTKLGEADIILKEREAHLKDLKRDRDQALKYKDINDKLRQAKASVLHHHITAKQQEITKLDERVAGHQKTLDAQRDEITKHQTTIAEHKKSIEAIRKEIERKGEVEQIKLQKELEQLHIQLATTRTQLIGYNREL